MKFDQLTTALERLGEDFDLIVVGLDQLKWGYEHSKESMELDYLVIVDT